MEGKGSSNGVGREPVYACKASVMTAFSKIPPAELGVYWWRAIELTLNVFKRLDSKGVMKRSKKVREQVEAIGKIFSSAARVWQDIGSQVALRNNRVVLVQKETQLYYMLHDLRAATEMSTLDSIHAFSEEDVCRFWYRYFGDQIDKNPPVEAFASSLRSYLLLDGKPFLLTEDKQEGFEPKKKVIHLMSNEIFTKMIQSVLEIDGDNELKLVTRSVWEKLIRRFGPIHQLYQNIRCVCTSLGDPCLWFMKAGNRSHALQVVRQGTTKWVIRLGRLAQDMAFVMTYRFKEGARHVPIVKDKDGYYNPGEEKRKFETVVHLVIDVCKRLEWYSSSYLLKEEEDARVTKEKFEAIDTDLSFKGKFQLLNELMKVTTDPTHPFHARLVEKKLGINGNTGAFVLKWLDDGQSRANMSSHLVDKLQPVDKKEAKKVLENLFKHVRDHLQKSSLEIEKLNAKVRNLEKRVAVYEGDEKVTQECTLQELLEMERKMHDSSRRLKNEIEAFYERSLTFPNEFLCPLTHEVFKDPVITKDGHTYERKAIEHWFNTHDTSPMTNMKLIDKSLTSNISLRNSILAFRERHKSVNMPKREE
mmetsp:Transcript_13775/g.20794  ORF Transcript_13775/g.20794 Transcript_13775/m.20794 type:complete len:589 (-) Transcript_13775:161-1927(-)